MAFEIFMYPDCSGGDSVTCTISLNSGSYQSMAAVINDCLFPGQDLCCELTLFSDITSGFWAEDFIYAIACEGITTGYADGTYRPSQSVQRSQMAAFIIKAKYGDSFSYSLTPHFTDVPSDHWAFRYIQKIHDECIASGYPDGTFHPSENVSRAQMATFIGRAFLSMR
jgi:hypothetical protein